MPRDIAVAWIFILCCLTMLGILAWYEPAPLKYALLGWR
jgi:hypothetical protein